MEQDIQTETQAERIGREEEAKAEVKSSKDKAKARAKEAKDTAAAKAKNVDTWLTRQFEGMSEGASSALVVANFAALIGLGAFLSFKAWGLYEKGRLGWRNAAVGLSILGVVGLGEGVFAK